MSLKTIYNNNPNINYNNIRQIAAQDPWFAIGEALVNGYAQNFNNRGVRKSVDKALNTYGTQPSINDEMEALKRVKQNYNLEAGKDLSVNPNDPVAVRQMAQELGMDTPKNRAMNNVSALNNPSNFQNDSEFDKMTLSNIASRLEKENALKQLGGIPLSTQEAANKVLERYSGKINPVQDEKSVIQELAQMPGADVYSRQAATRRAEEFNAEKALANARLQMIRDGRPPEQIEAALSQLTPHFQQMQDTAYKNKADRIMTALGAGNLSDAEYKQRIVDLAQLGEYGKDAANLFGKDIVTGREKWNAQLQDAREKQRYQQQNARDLLRYRQQQARDNENFQRRMAMRNNGYGGNGGVSKDDMALADRTINSLEKELAEMRITDPNATLSPDKIRLYNQMSNIRNKYMSEMMQRNGLGTSQDNAVTPKGNEGYTVDANDYKFIKPLIQTLVSKNGGKFDKNVAQAIRARYGLDPENANPNEWLNEIFKNEYGYVEGADVPKSNASGEPGFFEKIANAVQKNVKENKSLFSERIGDSATQWADYTKKQIEEERKKNSGKTYASAGRGYWSKS